jgi:hypothetical protein
MLDATSTPPRGVAQAKRRKRKAHPLSPIRGLMFRRMKELRLLAAFRRDYGVAFGDDRNWAFLTAEICLYRYEGHDLEVFESIAPFDIPTKVAKATLDRVRRTAARRGGMFKPTGGVAAGRSLDLTAEERWSCDIRTMHAVDETPAEAKARRQEEDRERKRQQRRNADKERERERSLRRRAAKGARPHAESFSQTRPWEAEGVSRRTWERRRAAKTSTPVRVAKTTGRHILTSICMLRTDEFASPAAAVRHNGSVRDLLGPAPAGGGVERRMRDRDGAAAKEREAEQAMVFNGDDAWWWPITGSEVRVEH